MAEDLKKFDIVLHSSLNKFVDTVNEALSIGYEVHGPVTFIDGQFIQPILLTRRLKWKKGEILTMYYSDLRVKLDDVVWFEDKTFQATVTEDVTEDDGMTKWTKGFSSDIWPVEDFTPEIRKENE